MLCGPAFAHFGMLIPSKATVSKADPKTVDMQISFSHPMEVVGMDMAKPKAYGVVAGGSKEDLLGTLKPIQVMGKAAWASPYTLKKPGVYIFHMEPEPYWEPAEDSFIVPLHQGRRAGLRRRGGLGQGSRPEDRDRPADPSLRALCRQRLPGDRQAGRQANALSPRWRSSSTTRRNKAEAPNEYLVTQVVKTDRNGVFTYAVPKAGWWGFAALTTADFKLKKDGKDKAVEIGGVIWVYFHDWQMKK